MSLLKIACAAGLAPLLLAAQAPSSQSVATPKTDASGAAKGNEVVCKKMDAPTGSRIGKRQVCKTKAEWDYIQTQQQEVLERAMRKPHDGS